MLADDIKIYEVLKEKLGPEVTQRIMEALDFQQTITEQLERNPYPSTDQLENRRAKLQLKILYGLLAGLGVLQVLVLFWLLSTP